MAQKRIGVAVVSREPATVVETIQRYERLGIPAAWMTLGGAAPDSLTMFAAAAMRTERIMLGTCIVPIWPRHPITVAQQALAIAGLAPGRFRLGLGPGHKQPIEDAYGYQFQAPLGHLREYIQVIKTLLRQGKVDFKGKHYRARASIGKPVEIPVMASALREKSFELCGAEADGAISWVCPGHYLRQVAVPAIERGARAVGRTPPPLITHAPVCVHDDRQEMLAAAREQVGFYPRAPFYAAMFNAAGYPEASQGAWSERMIDAVVLSGKEQSVAERLRELLTFSGEIIVTPIAAGANRDASVERTVRLVAEVAKTVPK
jgi:F420-dependent oxidoreductase-like protein